MPTYRANVDGQNYDLKSDKDLTPEEIMGHLDSAGVRPAPSQFESFGGGAARGAAPGVAGLLGGETGAAIGTALAPETGGLSLALPIVSAIIGGAGAYTGAKAGQDALANRFAPGSVLGTKAGEADTKANPYSEMMGNFFAMGAPNASSLLDSASSVLTKEGRQGLAGVLKNVRELGPQKAQALDEGGFEDLSKVLHIAGNAGLGAAQGTLQGQSPGDIALNAAGMTLFNDSWLHRGPTEHPAAPEVRENLSKVEKTDQDFNAKTQVAAEIINKGAANPDTSQAATAAAEVLGESIPKAHEEQKGDIAEALKPLAETPKEEPPPVPGPTDQSTEKDQTEAQVAEEERAARALQEGQENLEYHTKEETTPEQLTEPTNDNQAPNPTGTGSGGQDVPEVLPTREATEGEGPTGKVEGDVTDREGDSTPTERIISATYTDDNGVVHEAANHIDAAKKAGVEAPNSKKGRETADYGFMVEDSNGDKRVVTRREAAKLAKENGQLTEGSRIVRGRLHSNQIEMPEALKSEKSPATPVGASKPQSATSTLPEDSDAKKQVTASKETPLTEDQEVEVGKRLENSKEWNRFADEGDAEKANAIRRQTEQDVREGKTQASLLVDAVKDRNSKRLDERALTKWTPEVYEAVRKYGESGDRTGLSQLSPIMRGNVERVYEDLNNIEPSKLHLSLASSPVDGPVKKVTQAHVNKAKELLQKTPVGRKLLKGANIVPDWERALSHPDNKDRNFSAHEINVIKQSQGFYDPETGKSWAIRDNIESRPGQTPEESVARVLRHERMGHDGMAWMRENDPEFEKLYHKIAGDIPKEKLDAIADRYGHDPVHDKDRTIGEWFAQGMERLNHDQLPEPTSPLGRMYRAVKDWFARVFGKASATDQNVRDLAAAIAHSDLALEPRRGVGGEVEPSLKGMAEETLHDMKKAWKETGESVVETARSFGRFFKSSPERQSIAGTFDRATNKAGYIADQAGNAVELAARDSKVGVSDPAMIASTFVRTVRDDTGGKKGMLDRINEIEKKGLEAKLDRHGRKSVGQEAIKLLRTKWDELSKPANAAKDGTNFAFRAYTGEGGKLEYREGFAKGNYIDPDSGKFVFDEKSKGSGGGNFRQQKTFNDPAEAILAGKTPTDLRLNKLTESAVNTTMKAANKLKWQNSLETFKMPDGNPVLKPIPADGRVPEGYKSVTISPGRVVAIHEEMAPTIKALTSETSFPAIISKAASFLKHNSLVFDAYHGARFMQLQAAFERKMPSYRKGLSLMEYADKDLASAVNHKLITQEEADWAKTNRPKIEALMDHGLNAGKISDALFSDAVPLLPLAKQANNFIFQSLSRGIIAQSAVHALDRNAKLHPEWTKDQLHRNTAKEVNTYYRNLGSQGLFKSKTWQDTARALAFAPNWIEGMVRSEASGVGQLAKAPLTGKVGNIGAAMGTGLVASAAVAQLVNMLTRGKPTWENDEPGHKLDAWIPDSMQGTGGYFISPLSVFAETIHDAVKYSEAGENPPSVLAHIAGNKLSPMARTLKTFLTGKDFSGKPLHGMDYASAALNDLAPIPLAGRNVGEKGGRERQLLSFAGLKADPANSATANTYAMVDSWKADKGIKQHQITEPSEYKPLRTALEDGDMEKARDEYKKLSKEKKPEVIDKYFRNFPSHPITGSKDLEEKFLKSLDSGQKSIYHASQKDRERISQRFEAMRPYHF